MTIQRIDPDSQSKKFDLQGTKAIKMDWEIAPGGKLQVEGSSLTRAAGGGSEHPHPRPLSTSKTRVPPGSQ